MFFNDSPSLTQNKSKSLNNICVQIKFGGKYFEEAVTFSEIQDRQKAF